MFNLVFGVMFAVLLAMSGFTMYQQVMRKAPYQNEETVSALLRVTLAFGVLAFGFSCRSIYIGLPDGVQHDQRALYTAIQAWVIIDFFLALFVHWDVRFHDWSSGVLVAGNLNSGVFSLLQLVFGIVLIGLLAAEMQNYTGQGTNPDPAKVGLNGAGMYMVGFGLIFAVFETAAGFAMLERAFASIKALGSANAVFVTNKVALAIGVLAMGFACRHINLFIRDGAPAGADSSSVQLVHTIESFIIINWFLTWALQACSARVDW